MGKGRGGAQGTKYRMTLGAYQLLDRCDSLTHELVFFQLKL